MVELLAEIVVGLVATGDSVDAEHIAQLVADYAVVIAPSYTVLVLPFVVVVQTVAVLQTAVQVV